MSKYSKFVEKWKDCSKCRYSESRNKIVFARGKVPAEILFIGEAPGLSEDTIGIPFIGPAGRLLDHIISTAIYNHGNPRTYAITNLVSCIPEEYKKDNKDTSPRIDCVNACRERLVEFSKLVNPSLIVLVGMVSAKYIKSSSNIGLKKVDTATIEHPASLLRYNEGVRDYKISYAISVLTSAINETFDN